MNQLEYKNINLMQEIVKCLLRKIATFMISNKHMNQLKDKAQLNKALLLLKRIKCNYSMTPRNLLVHLLCQIKKDLRVT